MGTQFKAYDHYILQTRYNERFTPVPTSKREYKPAEFIKTLIPMQPEGSFHLDDIRGSSPVL